MIPHYLARQMFTFGTLFFLNAIIGCSTKESLPDPLAAGWQNKPVCEEVLNNEKVRVLKCTFAPQVGHERHYHPAHFGYVLAGSTFSIKDTTGVREVKLLTGSSFYSDGVAWHEVLNVGDSTAVFLIVEPK